MVMYLKKKKRQHILFSQTDGVLQLSLKQVERDGDPIKRCAAFAICAEHAVIGIQALSYILITPATAENSLCRGCH